MILSRLRWDRAAGIGRRGGRGGPRAVPARGGALLGAGLAHLRAARGARAGGARPPALRERVAAVLAVLDTATCAEDLSFLHSSSFFSRRVSNFSSCLKDRMQ